MAFAQIKGHLKLLPHIGLLMGVDAGHESVAAGIEIKINLRAHWLYDFHSGRGSLVGLGKRSILLVVDVLRSRTEYDGFTDVAGKFFCQIVIDTHRKTLGSVVGRLLDKPQRACSLLNGSLEEIHGW